VTCGTNKTGDCGYHRTHEHTCVSPFGTVVVVKGASGAIGRATARAFAARGAHVGLVARGDERLSGAARDVEAAGGKACVTPIDVSDPDQCEAAADEIERALGPSTCG
jgi:NAD(P)-dependent dehydrogenase (short-subunit alcohol dehydrogenase family)